MTGAFLLLMLAGTAFLGWNDVQRKQHLNHGIDERHLLVGSFILQGVILGIPLLFLGVPRVLPSFWAAAAGTVLINVVGQRLLFKAFSLSDASLVSPLRLITPPLVILTGYVFLGEHTSLLGAFGIVITVAGLWVLLFPGRVTLKLEPGVWYGLAASVLFAFSFPLDKQAVVASSALFMSATVFPVIGIISLLWHQLGDRRFSRQLLASIRNEPKRFFMLAATFSLGVLLTNQALNYSLAAYAASVKRLQAVWTIVFSGAFLQEKHLTRRLTAVAIMFGGVILSAMFK